MVPSRFDSVSEVPAGVEKLTVSEPSLKGGRNSVPKKGTVAAAATNSRPVMPKIHFGCWKPKLNSRVSFFLSQRTRPLSCSACIFILGSR